MNNATIAVIGFLQRLNPLVSMSLALAIGYGGSTLAWQLSHKAISTPVSNYQAPSLASNKISYDWQVLLTQHWFGEKKADNNALNTQKSALKTRHSAPETHLKLDLKGTLFSDNPKLATAIIAGPDGKARVYRPEKTLPSGIILDSVHPNQVILRRQQGYDLHYEVLKMKSATSLVQDKNITTAASRDPVLKLGKIRAQVLKNPTELAKWLRLQPVETQGSFKGYMISAGRDNRLFKQLNLQKGDIITRINGVALTGNIQSLQALQSLKNAKQLQIDLVRKGKPLARSFQF